MIDPALFQLMRMLTRAGFRQVWRQVKTPAGALMALMLIGMIGFGLAASVGMWLINGEIKRVGMISIVVDSMPLMFYLIAATMICLDNGRGFLELRPAELQFVLAGPFSDQQILSYRLITLAIGWIPMSLFFAVVMMPFRANVLGTFFGILLGGGFVLLLALLRTLMTPRMTPSIAVTVRAVALGSVALIVTEVSMRFVATIKPFSLERIKSAIDESWSCEVLTLPMRPFANLMHGSIDAMTLISFLIANGFVVLALACCYQFNSGFSELAVEGVARRMRKLERIKGGNLSSMSTNRVGRSLPMFPWLGGIGPIAWMQVTTALRRTGRIVPTLSLLSLIGIVSAAFYLHRAGETLTPAMRIGALPISMGGVAYLGFIITSLNQTGFGAPKRTLAWFHLLPIKPLPMAIAMVTGSAWVLWCIRVAVFFPAAILSSHSWLACLAILFAALAFDVAFVSAMSFVTATTGMRPTPDGPPDILHGARVILFMIVVVGVMIPTLAVSAIGALLAAAIADLSWGSCAFGAGLAASALQPLIWWASGYRFLQRELATA